MHDIFACFVPLTTAADVHLQGAAGLSGGSAAGGERSTLAGEAGAAERDGALGHGGAHAGGRGEGSHFDKGEDEKCGRWEDEEKRCAKAPSMSFLAPAQAQAFPDEDAAESCAA